jgi:hypothetical protein
VVPLPVRGHHGTTQGQMVLPDLFCHDGAKKRKKVKFILMKKRDGAKKRKTVKIILM